MSVFDGMKQKDQSSPDFSVFSGSGLSDQEYNEAIYPNSSRFTIGVVLGGRRLTELRREGGGFHCISRY